MSTKYTWTTPDGLTRYGGPRAPETTVGEKAIDKEVQSKFEQLLYDNGAKFDGINDDAPAINAALAGVKVTGYITEVRFPRSGLNFKIKSTIEIDAASFAVDFNRAAITADITGTTTAIRVTGSALLSTGAPGRNNLASISNFELIGPSETGSTIGVSFDGDSADVGPGPSRALLQNFLIHDFGEGIRHEDHSYGELIQHGDINNCNIGIRYNPAAAAKDMGESTTYHKVFVYQCASWGISVEGVHGTWLKLSACNLDHNQRQIQILAKSRVEAVSTHIEAADYTAAPILVTGDGALFNMIGGELVITFDGTRTIPYVVDNTSNRGYAGAFFRDVDFYKVWTSTGYFATGGGITRIYGHTGSSDRKIPKYLNSSDNFMVDGGFESTSFPADIIQIYGDTATITTALTGTNITITQDATAPSAGTKNLRVTKAGAAATTARFFIVIPLNETHKQRGTFKGKFKKTASGTVTINPVYARIVPGANAGMWVSKATAGSETALSFTDTSGTYITVETAGLAVKTADATPWATHYGLFIDMNNMAAGTLDIDELEMYLM